MKPFSVVPEIDEKSFSILFSVAPDSSTYVHCAMHSRCRQCSATGSSKYSATVRKKISDGFNAMITFNLERDA